MIRGFQHAGVAVYKLLGSKLKEGTHFEVGPELLLEIWANVLQDGVTAGVCAAP